MFTEIKSLLLIAKLYAKRKNLALSSVSSYCSNHGELLPKLDRGECSITVKRLERIYEWFSLHWPDDLEWPAGVERPEVTKGKDDG